MFNKTEYNEIPLTRRSAPFMDSIVGSSEGVVKLLKGLNPSKASGPDEFHARVTGLVTAVQVLYLLEICCRS